MDEFREGSQKVRSHTAAKTSLDLTHTLSYRTKLLCQRFPSMMAWCDIWASQHLVVRWINRAMSTSGGIRCFMSIDVQGLPPFYVPRVRKHNLQIVVLYRYRMEFSVESFDWFFPFQWTCALFLWKSRMPLIFPTSIFECIPLYVHTSQHPPYTFKKEPIPILRHPQYSHNLPMSALRNRSRNVLKTSFCAQALTLFLYIYCKFLLVRILFLTWLEGL